MSRFNKTNVAVSNMWGTEIYPLPLLSELPYTTACTTIKSWCISLRPHS